MATTTQNASSVPEPNPQDKTLMKTLNNKLQTKDFVLSRSFKNSRTVILSTLRQEPEKRQRFKTIFYKTEE
jgi:hypothetical protein